MWLSWSVMECHVTVMECHVAVMECHVTVMERHVTVMECHVRAATPYRDVAKQFFVENYEHYQQTVEVEMKLHGKDIYVSFLL